MYLVSFDVGRFQRKEKGSKRRTKAHATETIRHDRKMNITGNDYPLGSATYDMLKMDPYCQASIDAFASKWRVAHFPLGFSGKVRPGEVVSRGRSWHLYYAQFNIKIALEIWLLANEDRVEIMHPPLSGQDGKNHSKQSGRDVDYGNMSPSERFRYNYLRNTVSAKIGLKPVYRMSRRTWARQQAKLRKLDEEKMNLSVAMARFELGMGEVEASLLIPSLVEQYPPANLETIFPEKYEVYHRMEEEFIAKRDEYVQEYGKGWDVAVEYEVPDIMSLCYLEIFTCVQHGILARECSLCQRYFIVTGRPNMRQCPECRKNPSKAWREANKSISNEDGSSEG